MEVITIPLSNKAFKASNLIWYFVAADAQMTSPDIFYVCSTQLTLLSLLLYPGNKRDKTKDENDIKQNYPFSRIRLLIEKLDTYK